MDAPEFPQVIAELSGRNPNGVKEFILGIPEIQLKIDEFLAETRLGKEDTLPESIIKLSERVLEGCSTCIYNTLSDDRSDQVAGIGFSASCSSFDPLRDLPVVVFINDYDATYRATMVVTPPETGSLGKDIPPVAGKCGIRPAVLYQLQSPPQL